MFDFRSYRGLISSAHIRTAPVGLIGVNWLSTAPASQRSGLEPCSGLNFLEITITTSLLRSRLKARHATLWGGALRDEPKDGCEGD